MAPRLAVSSVGLVPSYKPHSNNTVDCANNFKVPRPLSTQSSWGFTCKDQPSLHKSSMPMAYLQFAHKLTSTRRAIENKSTN
eukprot:429835-Pelagomonas_calceolata.AAC.5